MRDECFQFTESCGWLWDQITVTAKYKTQHTYWLNGCAFGPKKGLQGGKTIQQRSEFLHCWSLMLLPVLWLMPLRSLHTCICVYSALRGCHTAAPSRSWDPWLRRTSRPQCGYILTSLNELANTIGDLTRHRVSWGSPLMVPFRVHMLSIDYQNYQIQKIKVQ